jgi:rubrerythrin
MHTTTQENLRTALRGEAFAGAKYLLFAAQARLNGRPDLAALFERTAAVEHREHFSEEAALTGLVGSDAANLRDAIAGEAYEVDVMYMRFADAAAAVGDAAAAARFAEIRRDEQGHLAAFQESLRRLEEGAAAQPAIRAVPSSPIARV